MKLLGRRTRTAVWGLFLAAAFVTTHLPPPKLRLPPDINDKLLHFTGFGVLGILTIWRMCDEPPGITVRALALSFVGLAVYGLIDEATQPYFGRTFDLWDWTADIVGAAAGTVITALCYRYALKAGETRPLG
jgi:VanZ family protein